MEKRKVIKFKCLVKQAHEIALRNRHFLIAKEDARGNVLLFFKNRDSFIECYGLAEEFLLDTYGSFWILDSPSEENFDYRKDIIKKLTSGEFLEFENGNL